MTSKDFRIRDIWELDGIQYRIEARLPDSQVLLHCLPTSTKLILHTQDFLTRFTFVSKYRKITNMTDIPALAHLIPAASELLPSTIIYIKTPLPAFLETAMGKTLGQLAPEIYKHAKNLFLYIPAKTDERAIYQPLIRKLHCDGVPHSQIMYYTGYSRSSIRRICLGLKRQGYTDIKTALSKIDDFSKYTLFQPLTPGAASAAYQNEQKESTA
ncbi:MAG: hypothetical protein HQL86_09285 [Magnetococcales bacterium]|nr:hypothetical protein [Magnetococcales bacterium]